MKKGFFFSLDALLAITLLLTALLLTNTYLSSQSTNNQEQLSIQEAQDLAKTLSTIRVAEINDTWVQARILDETIPDPSRTVLEQIGLFWALEQEENAQTLTEIVLGVHAKNAAQLIIESDVYGSADELSNIAVGSRRMISGITRGEALEGNTGIAFLQRINNKEKLITTYYGGFTGQGTITQQLLLPQDYTSAQLQTLELVAQTQGTFNLFINQNLCASSLSSSGEVNSWDLSSCATQLMPEQNNITIDFTSHINNSYISGGYIQARVLTDELITPTTQGLARYYFPQIEGYINLFDSIAAQGIIQEVDINLFLESEYDSFLRLGNQTMFFLSGEEGIRTIDLTRTITQNQAQLPLRLGLANTTGIGFVPGAPVDTALITDSSGSMNACGIFDDEPTQMCGYQYCSATFFGFCLGWTNIACPHTGTCSGNVCGSPSTNTRNHQVYEEFLCQASFMDLAQEAGKAFIDVILDESTEHRIGLIEYSTNIKSSISLTNDQSALYDEIDSYNPGGWTCSCCGLNYARMMVEGTENQQSIVLLSDGEINHWCADVYSVNPVTVGSPNPELGAQSAMESGQYACDKGIDVYTVGMGEEITEEWEQYLKDIACDESMYYDATSVEDLREVYELISGQILQVANYTGQSVEIVGEFNTTRIHEGSYIDIYYDPFTTINTQGKISLSFQENIFNEHPYCEGTIFLPQKAMLQDAVITSFSGNNWTKEVTITNSQGTHTIFNLSLFADQYRAVGDPFQIQLPTQALVTGEDNTITVRVGESPINTTTTCNPNNNIQYTALFNMSVARGPIQPEAQGCLWTIESLDESTVTIPIPQSYLGEKECFYTSSQIVYDEDDSYDDAVFRLLSQLDVFNDGRVMVNLDEEALQVIVSAVTDVPLLWGPARTTTVVSR